MYEFSSISTNSPSDNLFCGSETQAKFNGYFPGVMAKKVRTKAHNCDKVNEYHVVECYENH